MKKLALLLLMISLPASAETQSYPVPKRVPDDQLKCIYINYDHRPVMYYPGDGRVILLELWFEEHPEEAEKYYRRNAEMRKRAMKNTTAGLCN